MSKTSEQLTSQDGVSLHLFDLTAGGPDELLMLHGVGRAGRTFSSYATTMPERFRVRTIDFRGHGKSGRAGGRYRIVDYVQDAVTALKAIGKPAAVYGHSLGSLVAVAVATRFPALVSAIILEDPPSVRFWKTLESTHYYPTFQAMRRWAGRRDIPLSELAQGFGQEQIKTYADGRVLRIADVRDAVSLRFTASCIRDLDPAVMQVILDGRWDDGYDFDELLRAIQCPVLLLRGDVAKGGMLPEEDAERLMNLLSDGVRIDFATAGHLLHWQVRSEAATHVSAFLESAG